MTRPRRIEANNDDCRWQCHHGSDPPGELENTLAHHLPAEASYFYTGSSSCGRTRARAPRVRQCRTWPPATPVVKGHVRGLPEGWPLGAACSYSPCYRSYCSTPLRLFQLFVPHSSRDHNGGRRLKSTRTLRVPRHKGGLPVRWSTTWTT